MIDSRSISDLHPTLQRAAIELIKRCPLILITSTYRDNEMQNKLYAQGRTIPGKIVTNAKGGQSWHNYRLAFDICKNIKGHEYDDYSFFKKAADIWMDMGGEWGEIVNFKGDTPHMQFTNGLSLKDLQAGKTMPTTIKMPWELLEEDNELIENVTMKIINTMKPVPRILKDGRNFVELNTLKEYGIIDLQYDPTTKLVTINRK